MFLTENRKRQFAKISVKIALGVFGIPFHVVLNTSNKIIKSSPETLSYEVFLNFSKKVTYSIQYLSRKESPGSQKQQCRKVIISNYRNCNSN